MLKVLIADDEKGICRLLQYLIDWTAYGMEIIRVVHTGMDALSSIRELHPDIVITDVCMPGYSGIDIIRESKAKYPDIHFIMISGYREFEYARDALKYGADDYLLKPIKKEELTAALCRIINERIETQQNNSRREELLLYVQDTARSFRETFVLSLLEGTISPKWLTSSYCREKLHWNFSGDCFLCIAVKVDVPNERISYEERIDFFSKKGILILEQQAAEHKMTCCCGLKGDILLAVLNAEEKNISETKELLHRFLFQIREHMKQQSLHLHITIGKGETVNAAARLISSMQHAICALWERIMRNSDGVAEYQDSMDCSRTTLNFTDKKRLLKALEIADFPESIRILNEIESTVKNDRNLSGYGCYSLCREIASTIFLGIDLQFSKDALAEEKEKLAFSLENSAAKEELFDSLKQYIQSASDKLELQKESVSRKPIREARNYIALHFRNPELDLEEVSRVVGFNPSYFSRTFKEETGKKFIEYLTDLRMQESQKLLSETDLPISRIAEMAGYRDDKYFSRAFKKYSGLKPKEYRKLYFM